MAKHFNLEYIVLVIATKEVRSWTRHWTALPKKDFSSADLCSSSALAVTDARIDIKAATWEV
jgi:hypothetical protein